MKKKDLVSQFFVGYGIVFVVCNVLFFFLLLLNRSRLIDIIAHPISGISSEIETRLFSQVSSVFLLGSLFIFSGVGAFSFFFLRRIRDELGTVSEGVERFADRDFKRKIYEPPFIEIGRIVKAFHLIESQLDEKTNSAKQQTAEREAILSSISDAVIAIDRKGAILSVNSAAAEMFRIDRERLRGKPFQQVLGRLELEKFVDELFRSGIPFREQLHVFLQDSSILDVRGTLLRDSREEYIGAVLVFRDVSQVRKLESVRKEFVANVSHELKTPVTAIQGFVETLQDGAMDDSLVRSQFLDIIRRQSLRLSGMLDDLLSLARIENLETTRELDLQNVRIRELFESTFDLCEARAREKNVCLIMEPPEDGVIQIDRALIEQALSNLVVNGIKYTNPGGKVEVTARMLHDTTVFCVRDNGIGIAKHHFPRLFERFYRVDRSRNRTEGGSGLGLSIVKHAVHAHGGTISVESEVGVGSQFCVTLPNIPEGENRGRS